MNRNTVGMVMVASLGAFCVLAIAEDRPAAQDVKVADAKLSATDIAKQWQPPGTRDAHVLGGGDRIAYMRLTVNAPLADVWQFYARKIGYKGNNDFSQITGFDLDPNHVIISDQSRNIILLIHTTDDYTITVRIPKHDGEVTKDILVTIGTR